MVLSAPLLVTLALWAPAVESDPPKPKPGPEPPATSERAPVEPSAEGAGPSKAADSSDDEPDAPPSDDDEEKLRSPVDVEGGDQDSDVAFGSTVISLDGAVALALKQRPRLAAARHDVEALRTREGQIKAAYLPRVDGSLQYLRASENGNTVSFHSVRGLSRVGSARRPGVSGTDSFNNFLVGVAVQQQIWDFGRTQGQLGQQKAAVMEAEQIQIQLEQQIMFEVARAYYDVLAAREAVTVANDILATTKNIQELARASTETGLKPLSESARADANVAAAEVRVIRAEGDLERARAALAGVLADATGSYEPEAADVQPEAVPRRDAAIATALQARPELGILDANRDALKSGMKAVKSQQLPRIDALAGLHSRGQIMPRPAGIDSFQNFNWNVGVVVSVPIFQGLRVRKQKEEIEARLSAVAETRDEVQQAIVVEVRQALATVHAADKAALAAEAGVDAAQAALETLAGRYAEGLARLVELTDAQATYVTARLQLVDATYDRYVARAALRLAMGETPR